MLRYSVRIAILLLAIFPVGSRGQCDTLRAYVDTYNRLFASCASGKSDDAVELIAPEQQSALASLREGSFISHGAGDNAVSHSPLFPLDTSRFSLVQADEAALPVIYQVRPKETAFRIARVYFDIPIEALMMLNNLQSTDLRIDQRLFVGWYMPEAEALGESGHPDSNSVAEVHANRVPEGFDATGAVFQMGKGFWDKSYHDERHLFAMHKSARINSYMEITNPMFGRKLYAKVIGRIPATFRSDIDLIVSPAVARQLGIIDSRFYVHMRYVD